MYNTVDRKNGWLVCDNVFAICHFFLIAIAFLSLADTWEVPLPSVYTIIATITGSRVPPAPGECGADQVQWCHAVSPRYHHDRRDGRGPDLRCLVPPRPREAEPAGTVNGVLFGEEDAAAYAAQTPFTSTRTDSRSSSRRSPWESHTVVLGF